MQKSLKISTCLLIAVLCAIVVFSITRNRYKSKDLHTSMSTNGWSVCSFLSGIINWARSEMNSQIFSKMTKSDIVFRVYCCILNPLVQRCYGQIKR